MYTAISQTRNINIEASSRLLDTTSTEKRSYQYNKLFYTFISLPILRRSISKQVIISSLHYSCFLNEFSDIITIKGPSCRNTSRRSYHLTPANSFWSVGRPHLIGCCGSVPMDLTLLGSIQPHSSTVLPRGTNAGAAGGC